MTKEIMYHCTRKEFLDEILEHGLRPIKPLVKAFEGSYRVPKETVTAVFVSDKPYRWMNWAQGQPDDTLLPGAMITIDVTGLKKIPDPSQYGETRIGDYAVLEEIPKERFLGIVVSSEAEPCSFEPIKI